MDRKPEQGEKVINVSSIKDILSYEKSENMWRIVDTQDQECLVRLIDNEWHIIAIANEDNEWLASK